MKFSIGYTYQKWFLDFLKNNSEFIHSVYFPIPKSIWISWRDVFQQDNYEVEIFDFMKVCKENSIKTILLLNWWCEWEKSWLLEYISPILDYVNKLYDFWLTSISLTNMLYIPLIKNRFPNIEIYASVNTDLYTIEQCIYLKRLWVDVLTVYRDLNRDLETLKEIKKQTWLKIQLIINEGCMSECPYYRQHSSIQTHCVDNEDNFIWFAWCKKNFLDNLKTIFKLKIIRPEDMHYYSDIVDVYKLSTRGYSLDRIKFYFDVYEKWYYNWNYLNFFDFYQEELMKNTYWYIDNSLLTKYDFFNRIKNCWMDCTKCSLCDVYLQK